jgi:hypothetical protein
LTDISLCHVCLAYAVNPPRTDFSRELRKLPARFLVVPSAIAGRLRAGSSGLMEITKNSLQMEPKANRHTHIECHKVSAGRFFVAGLGQLLIANHGGAAAK